MKLSDLGACIGKKSYEDYRKLRQNVIDIINILSMDIDLGGQIDSSIMDEHDKIVFPALFRKMILDSLDTELSTANPDSPLGPGKYEFIREGSYNPEYLSFDFKKFEGCKMIIGPLAHPNQLKLSFMADTRYTQINDYRAKSSTWRKRINIEADLRSPLKDENDKDPAPVLDFSNMEAMEIFRTKKRDFPAVLAGRTAHHFSELKIGDSSIVEFFEKHLGNAEGRHE
jgi:hypothetical protein